MFDISKLSTVYSIRRMGENDLSIILNLENGNPLYFNYCPPKPSKQSVLNDLHALPVGKNMDDKFYIGFFKENRLVAIMDFIVSFPIKKLSILAFLWWIVKSLDKEREVLSLMRF